jgi:hypothetical protein
MIAVQKERLTTKLTRRAREPLALFAFPRGIFFVFFVSSWFHLLEFYADDLRITAAA